MKRLLISLALVLSMVIPALGAWETELKWIPPTTFADGTPLDATVDIKGYKVCYSTVSGVCSNFIEVGNVTSYLMTGIVNRKLFYTVRTIDQEGDESIDSNEVWRKISINPATVTKNTCAAKIICSK